MNGENWHGFKIGGHQTFAKKYVAEHFEYIHQMRVFGYSWRTIVLGLEDSDYMDEETIAKHYKTLCGMRKIQPVINVQHPRERARRESSHA